MMEDPDFRERPRGFWLREMFGLFLLFWMLLLVLSLVSYDPADPSLNHALSRKEVSNLGGLLGAYTAGFLNDLFGSGSLVLPVVLGGVAIGCLTRRLALSWWRWVGCILIGLCTLVFFAGLDIGIGELSGGGMIGAFIFKGTKTLLSPFGATLLWLFIFFVGLQLFVDLSWRSIGASVAAFLGRFVVRDDGDGDGDEKPAPLKLSKKRSVAKKLHENEDDDPLEDVESAGGRDGSAGEEGGVLDRAASRVLSGLHVDGLLDRVRTRRERTKALAGDEEDDRTPAPVHGRSGLHKVVILGEKDIPFASSDDCGVPMDHSYADQYAPRIHVPYVEPVEAVGRPAKSATVSRKDREMPLLDLLPVRPGEDEPAQARDAERKQAAPADGGLDIVDVEFRDGTPVAGMEPERPLREESRQEKGHRKAGLPNGKEALGDAVAEDRPLAEAVVEDRPLARPVAKDVAAARAVADEVLATRPLVQEDNRPAERPDIRKAKATSQSADLAGTAVREGHDEPSAAPAGHRTADRKRSEPRTQDAEGSSLRGAFAPVTPDPVRSEPSLAEPVHAEPSLAEAEGSGQRRARREKGPEADGGELVLPPLELLEKPSSDPDVSEDDIEECADALMNCLSDFGIQADLVRATPGPVVTTYMLRPAPGVSVRAFTRHTEDIARSLMAVSVFIQAPVPGTDTVGIVIPNRNRAVVNFREIAASDDFQNSSGALPLVVGKDTTGRPFVSDLAKMPHLLVAGATGQGKSVCLNAMLTSLLLRKTPDELKILLVDPKRVEMGMYEDESHLVHPVVKEISDAKNALLWAVHEMDQRYNQMSRLYVKNIAGYNAKLASYKGQVPPELADLAPMPYIVIVIDELADLMLQARKDVEPCIIRLAQLARACGIHMIIATQRPSVDVVTGLIKANFPCRICFRVSSRQDSITTLGFAGAEKLLGNGDMFFNPNGGHLTRLHGPFLRDEEVQSVVDFWKKQSRPEYQVDFATWNSEEGEGSEGGRQSGKMVDSDDALYREVVEFIREKGHVSTSLLQRRFNIGFNKAARYMDKLDSDGLVGPSPGAGKPRPVLMR